MGYELLGGRDLSGLPESFTAPRPGSTDKLSSHLFLNSIIVAILTKSSLNVSFIVEETGLERGGDIPSPPRWAESIGGCVSRGPWKDSVPPPPPIIGQDQVSLCLRSRSPGAEPVTGIHVHEEEGAREAG